MSSSASVTTIELFEVEVPLSEIARSAMAESDTGLGMAIAAEDPWLSAEFLYVRLVDEDGEVLHLVTHLAQVESEGQKLTERELIATCVLLLNAGHEATVNGFGNGMVALLARPDAGSGDPVNLRHIARLIAGASGAGCALPPPAHPADSGRFVGDSRGKRKADAGLAVGFGAHLQGRRTRSSWRTGSRSSGSGRGGWVRRRCCQRTREIRKVW